MQDARDDGVEVAYDHMTICKSFACRSRQITTPVPCYSVLTGRMPFLPSNQQRKSTEGDKYFINCLVHLCTCALRIGLIFENMVMNIIMTRWVGC